MNLNCEFEKIIFSPCLFTFPSLIDGKIESIFKIVPRKVQKKKLRLCNLTNKQIHKWKKYRSQVTFSHLIRAHRISFHFSSSSYLLQSFVVSIFRLQSIVIQRRSLSYFSFVVQFSLSVMFHVEWETKRRERERKRLGKEIHAGCKCIDGRRHTMASRRNAYNFQ